MIRFKIRGDLRFLSHAETMRVFQRACARAGVRIRHSEGFNPHPRLSLVLPRSVGVESEDELLCLWLEENEKEVDSELLKDALARELPDGIEIVSAELSRNKKVPEPNSVRYFIRAKKCEGGQFKDRINELLARGNITIARHGEDISKVKEVDIRPFLKSMSAEGEDIVVDCVIKSSGTIRVNEILNLLQLGAEDLAMPVMRKSVQYTEINTD